MPSENSLTADVPVNTIEKPLSVTLPNDSTTGTCYIGTRASDKDPWRYSLATDGINSNARFIRLSALKPENRLILKQIPIQIRNLAQTLKLIQIAVQKPILNQAQILAVQPTQVLLPIQVVQLLQTHL